MAHFTIAVQELGFGLGELPSQAIHTVEHFLQLWIWQESAQSIQERKRAGLDQRVGPAFEKRERFERFLGQELLMSQADQFGDLVRVQPQVLCVEFFGGAPVAHRYMNEHTRAGEHVQQLILLHDFSFLCVVHSEQCTAVFDWIA